MGQIFNPTNWIKPYQFVQNKSIQEFADLSLLIRNYMGWNADSKQISYLTQKWMYTPGKSSMTRWMAQLRSSARQPSHRLLFKWGKSNNSNRVAKGQNKKIVNLCFNCEVPRNDSMQFFTGHFGGYPVQKQPCPFSFCNLQIQISHQQESYQ